MHELRIPVNAQQKHLNHHHGFHQTIFLHPSPLPFSPTPQPRPSDRSIARSRSRHPNNDERVRTYSQKLSDRPPPSSLPPSSPPLSIYNPQQGRKKASKFARQTGLRRPRWRRPRPSARVGEMGGARASLCSTTRSRFRTTWRACSSCRTEGRTCR